MMQNEIPGLILQSVTPKLLHDRCDIYLRYLRWKQHGESHNFKELQSGKVSVSTLVQKRFSGNKPQAPASGSNRCSTLRQEVSTNHLKNCQEIGLFHLVPIFFPE